LNSNNFNPIFILFIIWRFSQQPNTEGTSETAKVHPKGQQKKNPEAKIAQKPHQ